MRQSKCLIRFGEVERSMTIRPATSTDINVLSELMIHSIRETNFKDYSAEDLELTYQNFTPAKVEEKMQVRDMFVYEREGNIIGTISLEGDVLHSLFVMPSLQGEGLGKLLVQHVLSLAKTRGLEIVRLSSSITAKPFYERLGFSVVEFEERTFGSTWLMERSLS